MRIKLFLDGADLALMERETANPQIQGFTTNPTLMRKAGVTDYAAFAREAVRLAGAKPVSLEVFADDWAGMMRQAKILAGFGPSVFVKLPVSDTRGVSTAPLIRTLTGAGLPLNITAVTTLAQVEAIAAALHPAVPAIVSIFAGRIADAGVNPIHPIRSARSYLGKSHQVLWASCREVLNVLQADQAGCDLITVTPDILRKLEGIGRPLEQISLETVQQFHRDAQAAGYLL